MTLYQAIRVGEAMITSSKTVEFDPNKMFKNYNYFDNMVGDALRFQRIDGGEEHFMDNWVGYGWADKEQSKFVWDTAKYLVGNYKIEMD
jgi:hypothetical protein